MTRPDQVVPGLTLYRCRFFRPELEEAVVVAKAGAWITFRRPDGTVFRENGVGVWEVSAELAVRGAIGSATRWMADDPDLLCTLFRLPDREAAVREFQAHLRDLCRLYAALVEV